MSPSIQNSPLSQSATFCRSVPNIPLPHIVTEHTILQSGPYTVLHVPLYTQLPSLSVSTILHFCSKYPSNPHCNRTHDPPVRSIHCFACPPLNTTPSLSVSTILPFCYKYPSTPQCNRTHDPPVRCIHCFAYPHLNSTPVSLSQHHSVVLFQISLYSPLYQNTRSTSPVQTLFSMSPSTHNSPLSQSAPFCRTVPKIPLPHIVTEHTILQSGPYTV
jgi:hypothetical protein